MSLYRKTKQSQWGVSLFWFSLWAFMYSAASQAVRLLLQWDLDPSKFWFHITSHPLHSAPCHTSQGRKPYSCTRVLDVLCPKEPAWFGSWSQNSMRFDSGTDLYKHSADLRNSTDRKKWKRITNLFQIKFKRCWFCLRSIVVIIDSD